MESMLAAIDARMSAQLAMLESLDEVQDPAVHDGPLWQSPERPSARPNQGANSPEAVAEAAPQKAASSAAEVPAFCQNGAAGEEVATWQNSSPRNEGAPASTPLLKEMDRIASNYSTLQGTSILQSPPGMSPTKQSMSASAMQASFSLLDQIIQPTSRAGQSLLAYTAEILGESNPRNTTEMAVEVHGTQQEQHQQQHQQQQPHNFRPSLVASGSGGQSITQASCQGSILECSSTGTDAADHASIDASFGSLLDRLANKSRRGHSGDQKFNGRRRAEPRHTRVTSRAFAHPNHSSASDSEADDLTYRWAKHKDTVSATSSSLASLSTTPSYSALRAGNEKVRLSANSSYDVAASSSSVDDSSKLVEIGSTLLFDGGGRSPKDSESDKSISSGSRSGVPRAENVRHYSSHRNRREGNNASNAKKKYRHRNHESRLEDMHVFDSIPKDTPEVTFSGNSVEVIPSHTWRDEGFLGVVRASNDERDESTVAVPNRTQLDRSLNGSASHANPSSAVRGAAENADLSNASSTEAMPNTTQRHDSSLFMSASASQYGSASDEDSLGSSDDALPSHTRLEASTFVDSRAASSDVDESDASGARTPRKLNSSAAERPRSAWKRTSPVVGPALSAPAPAAAPIAALSTTASFATAPSPSKAMPPRGQPIFPNDHTASTPQSGPVRWTNTGLEPFGESRRNIARGTTVLVTSEGTMTTNVTTSQTNQRGLRGNPRAPPPPLAEPKEHVVMMRDVAVGPQTPQSPQNSNGEGLRISDVDAGVGVGNAPTNDEGTFSDDSLGGDCRTREKRQNSAELRSNSHAQQCYDSSGVAAPLQGDSSQRANAGTVAHSPQTNRTQGFAWTAPEAADSTHGNSRVTNANPYQPSRVTAPRTVSRAATAAAAQGEAWAVAAHSRRQQECLAQNARTAWETRTAERADAAATAARAQREAQRAQDARDQAAAAFALVEARRRGSRVAESGYSNREIASGIVAAGGHDSDGPKSSSHIKHGINSIGRRTMSGYPPPAGGAAPVANYAKAQLFNARPQLQQTRRPPSQPAAPVPGPERASKTAAFNGYPSRKNMSQPMQAPLQALNHASEANSMRVDRTWRHGAMLDVPALGAVLGQLCEKVMKM